MYDIEQEMWEKKYVKQFLNPFFSSNKIELFDLFVCSVGAAIDDSHVVCNNQH